MRPRLFTVFAFVSLLLCMAAIACWADSGRRCRMFTVSWSWWPSADLKVYRSVTLKVVRHEWMLSWGSNEFYLDQAEHSVVDGTREWAARVRQEKGSRWFSYYASEVMANANYSPGRRVGSWLGFSRKVDVQSDALRSDRWNWIVADRDVSVVLPVAVFGLPPAAWAVRAWRARRRRREGQCPGCGYDLRATPERCPECGRVPGYADDSSPDAVARRQWLRRLTAASSAMCALFIAAWVVSCCFPLTWEFGREGNRKRIGSVQGRLLIDNERQRRRELAQYVAAEEAYRSEIEQLDSDYTKIVNYAAGRLAVEDMSRLRQVRNDALARLSRPALTVRPYAGVSVQYGWLVATCAVSPVRWMVGAVRRKLTCADAARSRINSHTQGSRGGDEGVTTSSAASA